MTKQPKAEKVETLERQWWFGLWRTFRRGRYAPQEALYGLMAAAVMIDGRRSPEEAAELEALVKRSKELSKLKDQRLAKIRGKIDAELVETDFRIHKMIDKACASLKGNWKGAAFAHAVDLIFADRVVPVAEQRFLVLIAEKLGIPVAEAGHILDQLKIKNEQDLPIVTKDEHKPAPAQYEGLTDKFKDLVGSMSPEEAFFGLLALAVFADAKEVPQETDEFRALTLRTKTLSKLNNDQRAKLHDTVWPQLVNDKREALFENACTSLPPHLRMAVYAQAADITLADQKLVHKEVKFLERLQKRLDISESAASDMVAVLRIKNAR